MDTKVKKMPKNFDALDKKMDRVFKKPFYSMTAIVIGLFVGVIIIAIMGANSGVFLASIVRGSFGSLPFFGTFIANMTWLGLAGLAFGVAYKVKQFNIGLVSQMIFGGIFAYWLGFYNNMGPIGFVVMIFVGGLVGSAVALLIGVLKTRLKVNEVITSIMMNWIALRFMQWFTDRNAFNPKADFTHVSGDAEFTKNIWQGKGGYQNAMNYGLERAGLGAFNWLIIVFVLAAIILGFVYKFSTWGQKTKIISNSPKVAKVTGINSEKTILQSYAISGLLAGFAGVALYLGVENGAFPQDAQAVPTKGFQGIGVSLIAFNNPFAVILVGGFIGMLESSTQAVGSQMPKESVQIVVALIIIISTTIVFFLNVDWGHKFSLYREQRKVKMHKRFGEEIPSLGNRISIYSKKTREKINKKIKRGGDK